MPHLEYVYHLLTDLENDIVLTNGRGVNTLFIGGGTPSLLSIRAIQLLLDGIRARIMLMLDAEITIEVNPGTVDVERFLGYKQAGVNRISLGVQSFDLEKLNSIGRIHDGQDTHRAAQQAVSLGLRSVNFDLMYGLPDQTLVGALDDLMQAIVLAPSHLSWYQLTIEPNTLFWAQPPKLPNDDILWNISQKGKQLLQAAGYCQYEISAYARAGFQCNHNLNYWRFGDYLGIGCGAHGKLTQLDGTVMRTVKNHHPRGYMQGNNYLSQRYLVAPSDLPFEYFMNRFRLLEATPRAEFTAYTGLDESKVRTALDTALASGFITESTHYWQVTDKGKSFLNLLLELFI
ncbi:Oxygen-independent coproporphyrinogen-III oxidase 1 [Candidatus Hoaglandella endobia]|uniref:Heme chaperone HemW n=2 Tax=Candidatus Hoaglandella endobia TaxID=1778263 RepID=A0A143WTH8_9ENTR|nr:Oxygen-independent coproporphyrinogen-III oxidase 1 [Candidatus Hoaglandella endobia]